MGVYQLTGILSLNRNILVIIQLLRLCLRNADVQNTVLKLCLHIGFGNSITDIEASLHCACVTLLTEQAQCREASISVILLPKPM